MNKSTPHSVLAGSATTLALALLAAVLPAQRAERADSAVRRALAALLTAEPTAPATARDFVELALARGVLRVPGEVGVAKEVFDRYVHKDAGARDARARPAMAGNGNNCGCGPQDAADRECNDTVGLAEDMSLAPGQVCMADGTVGAPGSDDARDVYRLRVVATQRVAITTTPRASGALPSALHLADAQGRLIANSAGSATDRRIAITLPEGVYYVTVAGSGSYHLTVAGTAADIPLLVDGATGSLAPPTEVATHRLQVGGPAARVRIEVNDQGSGGADYLFSVGRARGGIVAFVDDVVLPPATRPQNDPVLEIELPAGTYYLFVSEFLGNAASYRVRLTTTPLPSIASACGTAGYTIRHGGDMVLFALDLGATGHASLQTTPGTVPGVDPDSYVEVFDAEMGLLLFNDDDRGAGLYSYLDFTLPPGRYYVLCRTYATTDYTELGDYTLTGRCGLPVTISTVDNIRIGPTTIAAHGHFAFRYTACTPNPLVVEHSDNVTLVGADGLLRSAYQQMAAPGGRGEAGTTVYAGETVYGVQRTTDNAATTAATLFPHGKLGIDLAPVSATGAYSLMSDDKVDRMQFLFWSFGAAPVALASPFATIQGNICLDLRMGVHGFGAPSPMSGCRHRWTTPDLRVFVGLGIRFQGVSLDGSFTGGLTNIAP